MDAEYVERKAANVAWMKQAFARAKTDNSRGLVLMTQANPGFENQWPPEPKGRYFRNFIGVKPLNPPQPTGYDDYIQALAEELESYDKPVAFLHGDTHLFRIDKPLYSKKTKRLFENFTRVETFGNPDPLGPCDGRSGRSTGIPFQRGNYPRKYRQSTGTVNTMRNDANGPSRYIAPPHDLGR
jgi:hypothetical protein